MSINKNTNAKTSESQTNSENQVISQSTGMPDTAAIELKNYKGKEVITSKGDSIGTIDKLVTYHLDNAAYAVVSVGGFLGMREKNAAIPINQLRSQGDKWVLSSRVTKDSLKRGMKYDKSEFTAFEPTE
jgi:sporulation protein YlmC with PRC-barrel domain